MPLNILVAPSGFKEGLDATDVARAIAAGVQRALPEAQVVELPLMDGGEGFTRALVGATGGHVFSVPTSDPLGRPIMAEIGFLGSGNGGGRTAVIEVAAAAGLRLVAPDARDLDRASSAGVGLLVRHALDQGAARILIGCGDSGVNDGGAGLARALGARFLDAAGEELKPRASALAHLARIDLTGVDPRLAHCEIEVAVNWKNALIGPRGVSRVYGQQKGASPGLMECLDAALVRLAECVRAATGRDVARMPGAGASGGTAAALAGLCGARLVPRFEIIRRQLPFDEKLSAADLVLTAEGMVDAQSAAGKIPAEIASRARILGIPVIVLAGALGKGYETVDDIGIAACFAIADGPATLERSMQDASRLLECAAEQVTRCFASGFCAGRQLVSRRQEFRMMNSA